MLVVRDVRDRSGRMLVREGSELDERLLRVLRSWGVSSVEVARVEDLSAGQPEREDGAVDLVLEAQVEERLGLLFRHVDQRLEVASMLRRICAKRLMDEGDEVGGR